MSRAGLWTIDPPQVYQSVAAVLRSATPALLFGLRLWIAVCLALYIAFWLQLDSPSWAGTTAAIVCQPNLGSSLRKGWFRLVGTFTGGVAIIMLTACFPQDRTVFLISLALWGAVCAFASTLLQNYAAYAAALAGYTAVIIASDQLGATGGLNGEAFTLAISRVNEIGIGIVAAGIVLAGTDRGDARRQLATLFAGLEAPRWGARRSWDDRDRGFAGAWKHSRRLGGADQAPRILRYWSEGMNFVEVDLLGVHVAPISLMMIVAWVAVVVLRRTADRFGLLRHVWHPALVAMGMTADLEGGQGS
jgi:hypothetical protein